ncbi:MAG: lamin tail domain-containing protein [Myxococcota bacterium]
MPIAGWAFGVVVGLFACRDDAATETGLHLVVNEVLAKNDAAWVDPDSAECPEYDDFVELYNPGDAIPSLAGWTLTDDDGGVFAFPAIPLGAGALLVVVADEDPDQGELHAPFGVSSDGETVSLVDPAGAEVDRVDVPALDGDVAWGRYGDGGERWRVQAIPTPGAPNESPPPDPCLVPQPGFDDHTVPCIATAAGFEALAETRAGLSVAKFDLLSFQDPSARHAVFLDNRFYALHDEWYLFRMLNGQPVEGEGQYEPFDGSFTTWDALEDWARSVDLASLFPTEFAWFTATGRLTSFRFYDLALGSIRVIGVGTLVHAPATADREELWAFELEYSDPIAYDDLVVYFELLTRHLGPEIAGDLRWLVRSPAQQVLADRMVAEDLPYADRVLGYDALTAAPGTVEVYHEGTVAGRVRVIHAGESLDDAQATDVLVLEQVPDLLPPCAALITAVPQTPLAHIALLAESRGIPNLHVAGLADDPEWDDWSRIGAHVAIRATAPDGFEVTAMTAAEYEEWTALQAATTPTLDPVDGSTAPWTVDLQTVSADALLTERKILGGKSAGFLVLLDVGTETPDDPVGITIRAYQAQVAQMGFVDTLLAAPEFAHPGDARGRYLVLEGRSAYDGRYPEPVDQAYAEDLFARYPAGDWVGDRARGDGVRGLFVDTPVDPAILGAITPALEAAFGGYAPDQGLRLRSSSNIEDVEGFVGAGLYESHTGYLQGDGDETIEAALQRVWGSYWGFEAFEERHTAGIPHENGAMGVLVHANFADDHELSNGVITFTRLPPTDPTGDAYEMVVNAQLGAISVTNPPVDACRLILPEVAVVRGDASATRIERLQASTELPDGAVLDDAELRTLFDLTRPVVDRWLEVENAALAPALDRSTLTLDLEFREVDGGWPVTVGGPDRGQRLVLKQARSLEPSAAGLPDEVTDAPFPRDLLARARTVTAVTCRSASHTAVAIEATTDPALRPDLGYATVPFTASLTVDGAVYDHLDWDSAVHGADPWSLTVTLPAGDPDQIAIVDGTLRIDQDVEPLDGPCTTETLWASPDTYLDDLLDR